LKLNFPGEDIGLEILGCVARVPFRTAGPF
jgi:hypothetical protein